MPSERGSERMSLTDLVAAKRAKARKQTRILAWIILIYTVLLALLWRIVVSTALIFLFFFNPYLFLFTTMVYYSAPMTVVSIVLLVLAAVPLIGCRLLDQGKSFGKYLVLSCELLTIVLTAVVGFYEIYSLDGAEIVYQVPGYLLMLAFGVAIPAVVLFFLNRWVPKEARNKKRRRRF